MNQAKKQTLQRILDALISGGYGKRKGTYVYDSNHTANINGLKITDTDFNYGKYGETDTWHSISIVKKEGGVNYVGDMAA